MRVLPSLSLLISAVTIAIGAFFFAMPGRAARVWGQRALKGKPNGGRYRRLYRAAGLLLCLVGALMAMETWFYDEPPPPPVRRLPPPPPVTRLTAPASMTNVKVCV